MGVENEVVTDHKDGDPMTSSRPDGVESDGVEPTGKVPEREIFYEEDGKLKYDNEKVRPYAKTMTGLIVALGAMLGYELGAETQMQITDAIVQGGLLMGIVYIRIKQLKEHKKTT